MSALRWEDIPCDTEARNRDRSRSGHHRTGKRVSGRVLRRAWAEHHGAPWPEGSWALHHCDNPRCSEGSHIFPGDAKANIEDARTKGRVAASPFGVGETHTQAKRTEAEVRTIRARVAAGESQAAVARSLGTSSGYVNQVVQRKLWRHVA